MNASMAINADAPEEIIESYLGRMSAPDGDELLLQGVWWKKGLMLGLLAGLCLGLAGYFLADTDEGDSLGAKIQADKLSSPVQLSVVPTASAKESHAVFGIKEKEIPVQTERKQGGIASEQSHDDKVSSKHINTKIALVERKKRKTARFIKPKVPRLLLKRGWRFYSQGNYQSAAVAFGRAVHSSPRHTGGYYGLSLCLFEQGKEDVALKVLEKGAKLVGPKAGLWVLAGSIYQWMGKERMARIAYGRYLKNNPRGEYARDVRVILSRKELPKLLPFDDDLPEEIQTQ